MINDTLIWLGGSQETTATVVDYNSPQWHVYYPVFEFKDNSGSTITAQSIDGSVYPVFIIGERVQILYSTIKPVDNVRINSFTNVWLGPLFLTIGGVFNLVLSIGLIWNKTRKIHARLPPAAKAPGNATQAFRNYLLHILYN